MLNAFANTYEKQITKVNQESQVKMPIKEGEHKGNHTSNALSPKELREAIYQSRLSLYDSFNLAASSILDLFMPEAGDYREDITAEAIKEVELDILNKRIEHLKKTKPENYQANVEFYNRTYERIKLEKDKANKIEDMSEV